MSGGAGMSRIEDAAELLDRSGLGGSGDGGFSRAAGTFGAIAEALLIGAIEGGKRDRALEALEDAGLLEASALAESTAEEVSAHWASAGVKAPRGSAGPLLRVARWLAERHGGDPEALGAVATEALREELGAIPGVGGVTADRVLLRGLGRAVAPLDRPSYRILARHGWIDPGAEVEEAREALRRLTNPEGGGEREDAEAVGRRVEALGRIASRHCKTKSARCGDCPLREALPASGPVSWEEGD